MRHILKASALIYVVIIVLVASTFNSPVLARDPAKRHVLHGSRRGTTSRVREQPMRELPRGRTYYNGRYYGNFNNRFYGPQYGYF